MPHRFYIVGMVTDSATGVPFVIDLYGAPVVVAINNNPVSANYCKEYPCVVTGASSGLNFRTPNLEEPGEYKLHIRPMVASAGFYVDEQRRFTVSTTDFSVFEVHGGDPCYIKSVNIALEQGLFQPGYASLFYGTKLRPSTAYGYIIEDHPLPPKAGGLYLLLARGAYGSGHYRHRFWVDDRQGQGYVCVQDYRTCEINDYCRWNPLYAAQYKVMIDTINLYGPVQEFRTSYTITVSSP